MLRALTLERSQIKEAMGFALDNADAAGEVLVLKFCSFVRVIHLIGVLSFILNILMKIC